jgi:hypothetical protein
MVLLISEQGHKCRTSMPRGNPRLYNFLDILVGNQYPDMNKDYICGKLCGVVGRWEEMRPESDVLVIVDLRVGYYCAGTTDFETWSEEGSL